MTKLKPTAFVLLLVLIIVLGPFISIWGMNTLFPILAIPYTFKTWLAVIIVKSFFVTSVTSKGYNK